MTGVALPFFSWFFAGDPKEANPMSRKASVIPMKSFPSMFPSFFSE
jgi:hypothetical protein